MEAILMKTSRLSAGQDARPQSGHSSSLMLALVTAVLIAAPRTACAFSLFTGCDATGFSNIIAHPGDMYTWDLTTFTYKFDANFNARWPNPAVKQQIRLALQTWNQANMMPYGSTYSFNRSSGWQNFGDIRSVALHEIGHVFGMTHPDQGDAAGRNYRPSGGGYAALPDANNEVMRSWINPGDYNHVLSHDELDAFRLMYGRTFYFSEVPSNAAADITFQGYTNVSNNWAVGGSSGFYRTWNTCQGVRSTSGSVSFNVASSSKLGLKTKGINWDYRNISGQPTSQITIRTSGTNNMTPLFVYSNNGPRQFNSYYTYTTALIFLPAEQKDDILHVWSNPSGGPIPGGEILHVGLEQDVWDWSVVSAQAKSPSGTFSNLSLLSFHEWTNTIVTDTASLPSGDSVVDTTALDTKGTIYRLGRGIKLVNSDTRALVSDLLVGRVGDLGLQLPDLNEEGMHSLIANQRLEPIGEFGERMMGPGDEFYVIFQGNPEDVPPDAREKGSYLILDRPDLLDDELFVFARSRTEDGETGSYALVGNEPDGSTDLREVCSYGGEIPDPSPNGQDFPVIVEGMNGALTKVEVSATIFHPRDSDLELYLIAPDGRAVKLSSHNGTGANYGLDCPAQYGTTFDDDAELAIFQGDSPFKGSYRPEEPLSLFRGATGSQLNGLWRLRVFDTVQGQSGFLACWCLKLYTCEGDCAETIGSSPKIRYVEAWPSQVGVGEPVHVVVSVDDDTPNLAMVSANGYMLSNTGGGIWEGDIPAEPPYGPHMIHVVAGDSAGNTDEDSNASYVSVPAVHASNRDLVDRMIPNAPDNFVFGAAGRVMSVDGDLLEITDGSETPLRVSAPGHGLSVGDFCLTRGILDVSVYPATLYSTASRTLKAD